LIFASSVPPPCKNHIRPQKKIGDCTGEKKEGEKGKGTRAGALFYQPFWTPRMKKKKKPHRRGGGGKRNSFFYHHRLTGGEKRKRRGEYFYGRGGRERRERTVGIRQSFPWKGERRRFQVP